MAPSTTMVNAGIHDPGSVHGNMSTLTPLSQGQHGNTDTGSSPNIAAIVGGVLGPLTVIGVVAGLIYVWYRRKYPVRMVLGRDFAKFSNPAYNTRQSTLTLVREDSDKAWDTLTNPNLARGAVIDEEVEGYHNDAFEGDTETTVPDVNINVETEDVTNSEQTPTTVEEKEETRKISRERPKTKRAVLVKTPDVDEFDNAFELVTESDLGQRRESEISSGNDSIDTRTVSISISETFDNRHGSLVSYPGDSITPQQIQEEVNVQSNDASDLMENNSGQDKSSNEEDVNESETSDNKDNFESFVEVFNNEDLNKQGIDSIEQTNSEGGEDSLNSSEGHLANKVAEENVQDNVTTNGNEDPQNTTDENEIGGMSINHFKEEVNKQSEHSENSSTVVPDTETFENITVSSFEMQTTSIEPVVNDISYAQIITEECETISSNEDVQEIGKDNADTTEHLAVENGYVFCEENDDQEIRTENYSEENVDATKKGEDNSICLPDDNSVKSLSLSVDSIDRLSSTGSFTLDSSKKPQALSLSSERIYLENVPPTPTVLVQDSIIFESEAMHQIHLETPDVQPLRGRRAFTLNDIHLDKKIIENSNLSDSSSVKNVDARSTSSPEIRDMKYKGFNPSKRLSFDFSLIGDSSRSLDQPEGTQQESVDDTPGDNKHTFIDTILDNALLDSTVIKTNVGANESETIQASDSESEVNKEPANETNMFTSISSDVSEQFGSSSHFEEEKNVTLVDNETNEQSHHVKEYEFQFVPTTDNKLKYEAVNEHMSIEQNSDTSTSANKSGGNLVDVNTIQAEMSTDEFIVQHSSIIKDDSALQLELDRTDINDHTNTHFKHEKLEKFDEAYFSSGSKTTDNVDKPTDDGFIAVRNNDPIPTTQNSDDISADINNPANKKKVVAASFDFNMFGNDSDSESSSSVSTSDESDDEISKSFDTSTDKNSSSEDGETKGIYKFETMSTHSTKPHSNEPEFLKHKNNPDMSESTDSTTLSWELLSRENSADVNKLELCDKIDDDNADSISGDEAIGGHIEMIKPESNVTNKFLESSDTSWDVVGGIDDNSEC